MAKSKRMKDVEFAVDDASGNERIFKTWDEACGFAVSMAASGQSNVHINVLVWSRGGARRWMGDEGVSIYNEDPEASVFERIAISANSQGRIA